MDKIATGFASPQNALMGIWCYCFPRGTTAQYCPVLTQSPSDLQYTQDMFILDFATLVTDKYWGQGKTDKTKQIESELT